VIEWKWLESYDAARVATSAGGTDRVARYQGADRGPLLAADARRPHKRLFYEPYYQLVRQTLLAARAFADPTPRRWSGCTSTSSPRGATSFLPGRRSVAAIPATA